jgi:ribosomal protein L11 methyltransferase
MPYRIDIVHPPDDALDRLIRLGALDIEPVGQGLAALLPDGVSPERVAATLGVDDLSVSSAVGRDDGSVWVLVPAPTHAGGVRIAPADEAVRGDTIRLVDSAAFGTGLHPTTVLCLEALGSELTSSRYNTMLDVGTGSGILAFAALKHGATRVVAIDIEPTAIAAARENAALNDAADRLLLVLGGPESLIGSWPLVVANVLAAPLVEMAPTLVRRVGHQGRAILSGIPASMANEVERTYVRLGMRAVRQDVREGWAAMVLAASW